MLLTDRRNVVIQVVRIRCSWEKKKRVVVRCDDLKFLNYYKKKKKISHHKSSQRTDPSEFFFIFNVDAFLNLRRCQDSSTYQKVMTTPSSVLTFVCTQLSKENLVLPFLNIYMSAMIQYLLGFPSGASAKEPAYQCWRCKRRRFDPGVGKIPWRRAWKPPPVFLPGESHEQRSLARYSPWGCKQLDMTEETQHTHGVYYSPFASFKHYVCKIHSCFCLLL